MHVCICVHVCVVCFGLLSIAVINIMTKTYLGEKEFLLHSHRPSLRVVGTGTHTGTKAWIMDVYTHQDQLLSYPSQARLYRCGIISSKLDPIASIIN